MENRSAHAFRDPWQDPYFSPDHAAGGKAGAGSTARSRQQARFRSRIGILSLFVVVVWTGLLLDLALGRLVLGVLVALGAGLTVLVGAMALGIMGHGLFAIGDQLIAWMRKSSAWPED